MGDGADNAGNELADGMGVTECVADIVGLADDVGDEPVLVVVRIDDTEIEDTVLDWDELAVDVDVVDDDDIEDCVVVEEEEDVDDAALLPLFLIAKLLDAQTSLDDVGPTLRSAAWAAPEEALWPALVFFVTSSGLVLLGFMGPFSSGGLSSTFSVPK